jgi:hypothetical protein
VGAYVFGRGSNVLEYWLARAEGFGVRARGSRVGVVEDVVLDPARGTASALVLSSRFLHRRRVVLARTVEAVDPEARVFELEVKERSPQPSRLARFVRWSAPRVHALALATWRLMRKYGHDAYESCRTGRVREAARGARGGAERAASWGSARASRGVRRMSHGSLHRLWR